MVEECGYLLRCDATDTRQLHQIVAKGHAANHVRRIVKAHHQTIMKQVNLHLWYFR